MKKNASRKHVQSVAGEERFWVVVGQSGASAIPIVSVDPPVFGRGDLGAIGLADQQEQHRAKTYLAKHPTHGFEGFLKKNQKAIRNGQVVVAPNPNAIEGRENPQQTKPRQNQKKFRSSVSFGFSG